MTVTHYTLKKKNAPRLRLVLLADLHGRICAPLLPAVKRLAPDLILMAGDMINGAIARDLRTLSLFSGLAAIAPTYYSLGNHERATLQEDEYAVRDTGAVLLDDACITQGALSIGGLSSGFLGGRQTALMRTTPPDLPFLSDFAHRRGFRILLCHHPEYYPRYIKQTTIDIILSGHAHGGQCRIGNRGLFAPGQGIFPRLTDGIYDGRLIVSRGLSNTVPLPRFANDTQLVCIDLTAGKDSVQS